MTGHCATPGVTEPPPLTVTPALSTRISAETRSGRLTAAFSDTSPPTEAENRSLILFDSGDEVTVQAGEEGIRFLLVSGKPLEEPVAWYGPIVMNTKTELQTAINELNDGTFIKHR